jgi:uncharacterized protein YqeY
MGFMEQISADIKNAMLAKEKEKLQALRDIKSKLLLEATSGNGEVSDDVAVKIIMKLHKQRMETYAVYVAQNREDLAKDELFEAQVMEVYLPKMMSEERPIRSHFSRSSVIIVLRSSQRSTCHW